MDALLLLVAIASGGADPAPTPDVWGVGPPGPLIQGREDVWCHAPSAAAGEAVPPSGPAVPPSPAPTHADHPAPSVLPHGVFGALRAHPPARSASQAAGRAAVEAPGSAEPPTAPAPPPPLAAPAAPAERVWPPAYAPGPPGDGTLQRMPVGEPSPEQLPAAPRPLK
jgi:hypothetical protein